MVLVLVTLPVLLGTARFVLDTAEKLLDLRDEVRAAKGVVDAAKGEELRHVSLVLTKEEVERLRSFPEFKRGIQAAAGFERVGAI